MYDDDGWTPLHHAAEVDNWTIANLLIKNGANLEMKANGDISDTPVHVAAMNGKTE